MSNEISMQSQKNYSLGMTEVEARQFAEIRGKMQLAKMFPRDPEEAMRRILKECENIKLAEDAVYSYTRGDSEVKGPSIRLAEVIASHWGNFTCGVTELEQRAGESTVKAYAWDLETNYSDEKIFTVSHTRVVNKKVNGRTEKITITLTDPRDIYEMVANQGARRKRACIFAVIPAHLTDVATEACQKTLEDSINKEGLEITRAKMLEAFAQLDEAITKEVLEEKVGKDFDKFGSKDIVKLKNLYAAIRDGFVKPAAAFNLGKGSEEMELSEDDAARLDELKDIMNKKPEAPQEAPGSKEESQNTGTDTPSEAPPESVNESHSKDKQKEDVQAKKPDTKAAGRSKTVSGKVRDGAPDFVKQAESEDAGDGEQQQLPVR